MTTLSAEQAVLDGVPKQLLIAGAWRDGAEGATVAVEDPATGETIASVADATAGDALDALGAADRAFGSWRETAPRERGEILRRAFEAVTDAGRRARAAHDARDGQAGRRVARGGHVRGRVPALVLRGGGAHRRPLHDPPAGSGRLLTMRQPVGPCIFITPWNFPLAMGTRKIGPAIAAGCTMVVKPAKLTPLSMLALGADPRGGRAAGGRAQRRHRVVVGAGHGAAASATRGRASSRSPARRRSGAS